MIITLRRPSWLFWRHCLWLLVWSCTALVAQADEATIRKNLAERLPNLPAIDEVRPSPMPGLFEVRIQQSQLFYTDAQGQYLIQGELIDTRTGTNLTEARVADLTRIRFDDLPLSDAFITVRGNGRQRIAVFSDPNCGFCKRLDRELARTTDITVYTFLVAMLGPDSLAKSRHIWCARDRAKTYNDWMLDGATPPAAQCDTAGLDRNRALAQQLGIQGTPTTFLGDGTRVIGADIARIRQGTAATPRR
jgi:thiol:disulfide interchange protein DsbC